ncbi:Inositol-tetrakisphosphate 1-kinase [Musa troglodytarum]|uniref:Inositol-tetrakisphosphate 1-kinase n=1 Tax=Musa troglodytarum TaxID=320322 RepID=A0A9E7F284_9LILI|nr:Inositol-tetrakisphosphate 1-kinase [Musa troglodytarum]
MAPRRPRCAAGQPLVALSLRAMSRWFASGRSGPSDGEPTLRVGVRDAGSGPSRHVADRRILRQLLDSRPPPLITARGEISPPRRFAIRESESTASDGTSLSLSYKRSPILASSPSSPFAIGDRRGIGRVC